MDWLAPFTNLSYVILAHRDFRSRELYKLHAKGKPVIRTGPNSLSYRDPAATRDVHGHGTKCTKTTSTQWSQAPTSILRTSPTSTSISASAYALKNLKGW